MIRPKRILELGTFTGYSALCLAEGLAEGGRLITIEHNDELEETIQRNLSRSPLCERIELRIGDCKLVIDDLKDQVFDLVFIDADKREYCAYLDAVYPFKQTLGLRAFNDKLKEDDRFEQVILPLRDGLTLIRKVK